MASTSDGKSRDAEIEFSSMRQPPLIKQLKGILSEYPDGGQILKEMIQNAEDAEASEVKILYNARRINDTTGEATPAYNRFFKGPSLCIYNDAEFTEKDWEGIRMIYSSVKEGDPLTVGRFGLGFKSVFHITDYPCVISGHKMLLIDPQQSADKVNAMVNLADIEQLEHKGLNAEAFWQAFDGMFGFKKDCVKCGYFKGTIFWFPLRERESDVSGTLYDGTKVLDLFDGFKTEASSILIFLKNLEKISVSTIKDDGKLDEIIRIEIDDNLGKLKQGRAKFKEKIRLLASDYKGEDITVDFQISIRTTLNGIDECAQWQVVNYFVGNSASSEFKKLIQDKDIGYSPYVGVASPLGKQNKKFRGHVFCFLPLPREGSGLTGLPVHVNGFFALSQNRHHLKWETDEQKGKRIDDKNILWNKCIIKEALPRAYSRLVQCVVDVSNNLGNTDDSIASVYSCLPLASNSQNKWKILETELYKKIKKLRVLYSEHKNKWVTIADASFASFDNLPEDQRHVKNAVIKCLSLLGRLHVEMPSEVLQNLQKHFQAIKDLSPDALANQLRQNAAYKNLSPSDKLDVLTYLFFGGKNYQKVEGLELLPLANGGWMSFKSQGAPVFLSTDEEIEILKGLEGKMIKKGCTLGTTIAQHIETLCSNGLFQIKKLTATELAELIETTVTSHLGENPCISHTSKLSFDWLERTWTYLIEKKYLSHITEVHIVPVVTTDTWDTPKSVVLISLSNTILVKASNKEEIPKELCTCFETMGVKVIACLPEWIPRDKVKSHFYWPSQKSMVALLTRLGNTEPVDEIACAFNSNCERTNKLVFAAFLAKLQHNLTEEALTFLRMLKMFRANNSMEDSGKDTAVVETNCYINDGEQFPEGIVFPRRCIVSSRSQETLLSTLGARKIELEELVLDTLTSFQKKEPNKPNEIPKFMDFFISKFHLFQTNDTLINAASNIAFLRAGTQRCRASDLFDPTDSNLHDMLIGDPFLPETKKRLSSEKIRILKFLGLKGPEEITADIILQVAKTLNTWPNNNESAKCTSKAKSLMNFLQHRPSILAESCSENGLTLAKNITNLFCIPVESSRIQPYPDCVKWFSEGQVLCKPCEAKEASLNLLIGATKPIIVCTSEKINTVFGWKNPPILVDVIAQLKYVSECFTVENRPDIMPMIKALYGHLLQSHREIWNKKQEFANAKLVWTGEEFVTADRVIVEQKPDDLNLYPYFSFIPTEFRKMRQLFISFGCRMGQNLTVLIETLHKIKSVHTKQHEEQLVIRDKQITCNILDRLALHVNKLPASSVESEILILVHDSNPNCLRLFPLSQCTYDDDPTCYFEDDENVHIVHEMLSANTVESLGVKSVTSKVLLDAEELGVEEWGQQEPLTTRIHTLLRDGYTDGLSVPKELIQNADDAGASEVKFLYDERQNSDFKRKVFSNGMRNFQGPALWVFNNARFSADDMKNITKLNAATKQTDVRKIGKFGLGFCSVYNLTDLPSFLSGSNLIFFDPHEKHISNVLRSNGTGLKYKLPNKTLVSRHIDQFMPYSGIFGCNIEDTNFKEFEGTLFRLPLRTEQQARESLISSLSYTNEEMITLLQMFIKAAGNFLLFTQNVKRIEIYHLPKGAKTTADQKLIYFIEKSSMKWKQGFSEPIYENILARMPMVMQKPEEFQEIHKSVVRQTLTKNAKRFVPDIEGFDNFETKWIISWARGDGKSLKMSRQMSSEGALPLSTIAVPFTETDVLTILNLSDIKFGFYEEGHVFCFLPLPLPTKLQFHINGCFAVTSDRRQLATLTEDDKGSKGNMWNVALMEDSLVKAFLHLIQAIANSKLKASRDYEYFTLWPTMSATIALPFQESFYKTVIKTNMNVFKGCQKWISFNDVVFLDPKIRESDIGELAFTIMTHFHPRNGKTLIEMPRQIFENIKHYNRKNENFVSSAQIGEKEFLLKFLGTLEYSEFWCDRIEERNKLIMYTLKSRCDEVKHKMREIRCIPLEPTNSLARPADLIHPVSPVAPLFDEHEEVFPLKSKAFRKESTLKRLVDLGMNAVFLSNALLINRCMSVEATARKCCTCAKERFVNLMRYLSHENVLDKLEKDKITVEKVKEQFLFPVLSKPTGWKFSWRADANSAQIKVYSDELGCSKHKPSLSTNLVLGKSKNLFRQSTADYTGLVGMMVDEMYTVPLKENRKNSENLLQMVGIKDLQDIPVEILSQQIKTLSEEYNDPKEQLEDIAKFTDKIFKYIEKKMKHSDTVELVKPPLESLRNCRFVLIGKELLHAHKVAFNVKEECRPHLYRLPEIDKFTKGTIYAYLGVQQHFSAEIIINVMKSVRQKVGEADTIEAVNNLLIDLDEAMQKDNTTYEDLIDFHDEIIAPDTKCVLYPTNQLVVENEDYRASSSMKILHPSVTPDVARRLGAKIKQLRCFQEISVGISFGQREKLVTRIKGLLNAYPCDSSIMKELLQNADDAGATEIHFVKDYRTHSAKHLFQASCEVLQGPALCVYNNSYFTQEDIEGIHNLGQGSKSDDPTKTGQYGVGFNAVYHLTDTPSFVTIGPGNEDEGLMFILDPLCKHVPQATKLEPGAMCKLTDLELNFSDHLIGFSINELIKEGVGTVFRLPLRIKASDISTEEMTFLKVDDMLHSFEADMFESVLFLKNINCIKVMNITSGELVEEYSVKVELTEKAEQDRMKFKDATDTLNKANINSRHRNLESDPIEVIYEMNVKDTRKNSKDWIIVQRFGILDGNGNHFDEIRDHLRSGDLGLLPVGGVAIQLNSSLSTCLSKKEKDTDTQDDKEGYLCSRENVGAIEKNKHHGRAFCFLPLPITTGLPVHINGHFALDHEARRDLWKDGYRMKWNTCILNNVVIPAWMSGLLYLSSVISPSLQNAKTWHMINTLLGGYHTLFPVENCSSDTWNNVSYQFYVHALAEHVNLFPCIIENKSDLTSEHVAVAKNSGRFRIIWTSVCDATKENGFKGVFKTVEDEMGVKLYSDHKHILLIVKLLKSFGMKLLETPHRIKKAMDKAGIKNVPTSSPSLVNVFLKTFSHENKTWSCDLGSVGSHISETKYITPDNLDVLLEYIMLDKDSSENMTGLPILLTADEMLRVCTVESPVFISKYTRLLPKSAHLFVHDKICLTLADPKLFQSGIFKKFQFNDFVQLLPNSIDVSQYNTGLAVNIKTEHNVDDKRGSLISQDWLTLFYDLLCESSFTQRLEENKASKYVSSLYQSEPKVDNDILKTNIEVLSEWSLLPCFENERNSVLIPMKNTFHLLFLSSLDKENKIGQALEKFRLPKLNTKAFNECHRQKDVKRSMKNIVASLSRPYDLLRCLNFHKDKLKSSKSITAEDGITVLAFFDRHLSVLQKYSTRDTIVSLLCDLPFYLTQQGSMTYLATTKQVLVIPKGMPNGGIQTWADKNSITLLQENETLESLYKFLGLQKADEDYVYGQKILPTLDAMPCNHWMEHIEYLKNKLGYKQFLTDNQSKIIRQLKAIAFVNVNGVPKRANQLYDPTNTTFRYLAKSSECLPSNMATSEWLQFLKMLDLKCEVNDEMLLMFARDIERESLISFEDSLRKKSKVLLTHFVDRPGSDWKSNTLSQLQTVKFIEPFMVDDKLSDICNQYGNKDRFICFNDCISSDHVDLCWSSVTLLPSEYNSKLEERVRKQLGIYDKPPLNKVFQHFLNVCKSLRIKINDGTVCDLYVKEQMSCFYEYFNSCTSLDYQMISKLQCEPFIHLPEEKEIVVVNKVVVDLPSVSEIKPHLYKAPTYYGKYYDLFRKIGSKSTVMFSHYASILQQVKDTCKENEMSVPERALVKRAFLGLVQLELSEDKSMEEIRSLFLPTQKMFLKDSKQVIISNKLLYEVRLRGNIELDICAGESFLDLKTVSLEEVVAKWPEHLKPILLTNVVKEEVCFDHALNQRPVKSRKASEIEKFLHSSELVTGLCRLIKHQGIKDTSDKFDPESTETEISNNLRNVSVVELPTLRTVLKYQGRSVSGSELVISYHIQQEKENLSRQITFYFNDKSKTEKVYIPRILHGIITLINICANRLSSESLVHVTLLIQSLETPHKIHTILDHLNMKPYGSPQTTITDYFPKPGTYVESQFIPFLEQGISPFKKFEYDHVAMELDDSCLDRDDEGGLNPLFIYVKILQEDEYEENVTNDLRRIYIVVTGNSDIPTEKVPIYRLYRFVRKDICKGTDIEIYSGETRKQQISVDEICKKIREELRQAWTLPEEDRKRVVKRILLKWHPDKNRGNEEYCTKVFQYIQVILSRLENGEMLEEDIETEMKRGKSHFSQSSSTFYENVFRRAKSYARAYYDNFDAYNRSERTGNYAHSTSTEVKRQDHAEAQRWLRQAKNDFLTASELIPTASGINSFNWVCYICHQVCEKALKSAHYTKDANNVPEGIFLPSLALTTEMRTQATLLEQRLGAHGRLRYPDALSRPRIPSDMFDREDAEFALSKAKAILELVEEYI